MNKLVNICIPTYRNSLKGFKKTIESALNQSYPKIKILVSDNHPLDDEKEVYIKNILLKKNRNIVYFKQSHYLKVDENWDFIINEADADYMMVLGCDDEISKNYIEDAIKILEKNQKLYAVSGKWISNYENKNVGADIKTYKYEQEDSIDRISSYLHEFNDTYINAVARTKVLQNVGLKKTAKKFWFLSERDLSNRFTQFLFACLIEAPCTSLENILYIHNAPGWPKNNKKISFFEFLFNVLKSYFRYFNLYFNFYIILNRKIKRNKVKLFFIVFKGFIKIFNLNTKKNLKKFINFLTKKKNLY